MTASEDDLVRRLKQGDEPAQRQLWDEFYPVVYRHVLFEKARGSNKADTADITQDVFVRAHRSIAKFAGRSSLKTWLITLARNAAIDFYRAPHHDVEDIGHDEASAACEAAERYVAGTAEPAEPPRGCIQRQESDLCAQLLAQLTEVQRSVFIHRQIDGLSVAETAELLGKKEGAVKMALKRALEKLGALAEEAERKESEEVATYE